VLIGSHFDTVRNGGKYDGQYGVIGPISCVAALHESGVKLPFAVEIIGFADEEGVRFRSTFLGSRAVTGKFDFSLLERRDDQGMTMAEALQHYGLDPTRINRAARDRERVLGYLEIHIEQGPVLLQENLPLGVVTSIAGVSRFQATCTGLAGHAGTVPMHMRQDACTAVAELALFVEKRCSGVESLLGTVGLFSVRGGSANVIPGVVDFSVDVRGATDPLREAAVGDILAAAGRIGEERNVRFEFNKIFEAGATPCAPWLIEKITAGIEKQRIPVRRLPSGATHDAVAMAELCDVGMIFVRCGNGGISHNPAEIMTAEDAELGARVLLDVILSFVAD
jgi:hydantoinase/carbamoylase family amidase